MLIPALVRRERPRTDLEAALLALTCHCPKRARAFDLLCSIPGLGRVTAVAILVACPEIGTLTAKQIASPAGLAPMPRQSGRRHRRPDRWRVLGDPGTAVIPGGRKFLRDALYMPAKVALTALMRQMIDLANALAQENREWTPKTA